MRTAAYNDNVASDRRRRQNVPRHILCSIYRNKVTVQNLLRICEGTEQLRKKSSGYYEQQGGCYGYF